MRIGINTRNLIPNKMEGFGHYTFEIVSRLISNHPEHEFLLFFDRPIDPSFTFGPNAKGIVLSPPTRHPILYLIWFEIKLTYDTESVVFCSKIDKLAIISSI